MIYRLYLNYNAKLTAERQAINHRHNILQQCYSNTGVLSESLLLEKSKEKQGKFIKDKLSFHSMSTG